jgi:pimeloyl-ACP methyl ester carboxylesterase
MSQGRMGWTRPWLMMVAVAVATATVGAALAQDAAPGGRGKAASKARRGKAAKTNKTDKKGRPAAADPLARAVDDTLAKAAPPGTGHYRFKMNVPGDTTLASTYYPSKLGPTAPVVLLIHEKDRSSKDFEEAIGELKGQGLAEHLQGAGYAVLLIDLRGHGANPRRTVSAKDWRAMTVDLQAAYLFLLDRHNRGELNLNKLGVVAVGEGANLAAGWAATPGAAVSTEGRNSDLGALVLVSPTAIEGREGLESVLTTLAPRVPLMLMVGERDTDSNVAVKAVRPFVERTKTNKIELFPSSLHGYKLLRLEPKVSSVLTRFLDSTLKSRADEWEPRYNLNPVAYSDIQFERNITPTKTMDAPAKDEAKAKDAPPEKKDAPPAKAKAKGAPR